MLPLTEVAAKLDLTDTHLTPWGPGAAKIDPAVLETPAAGEGKVVLVTALTPTPAGEGKTTTSIALGQALTARGQRAACALREPSLGPTFGVKGGGTGGGRCRLEPSQRIDLHLTGDLHAVTSANNLLAALVDTHLHFRKSPALDPRRVTWRRVLDMNDRALREIVVGMGQGNGLPRQSGFDITAASEVMAVLCLASDLDDLKSRLGRIVVGFGPSGDAITASDLKAADSMAALLVDAMQPNLVQTTEGTPAIVHGGPFANIAHGCNSVMATRVARHLADWTVTEAGFGMDLGGEKFLHIKAPLAGIDPVAVVLVATVRALKYHGGSSLAELTTPDPSRVEGGLPNLLKHVESLRAFGKNPVIALNKRSEDTADEIDVVRRAAESWGTGFAISDGFARGGEGSLPLADAVMEAAKSPTPLTPIAPPDGTIAEKLRAIVRTVYGGNDVVFVGRAKGDLKRMARNGWDRLPVCVAKTQSSLSADPKLRCRPTGFDVPVRRLLPSTGAGFVVAIAGDMVRMPGLPRRPASDGVSVVDGVITGL